MVIIFQGGSAEVELKKGQTFKLSVDKTYATKGNSDTVYVDYENISKVLKVGNRVFVDDGLISLIVTQISKLIIFCCFKSVSSNILCFYKKFNF